MKLPLFAHWSLGACAAMLPRPASAQTSSAAPVAKPSLEVQVSTTVKDGKNCLVLDPVQPHLNVVLRNTSDKSVAIFEEWNSAGANNLWLEITAIDGKPLASPLNVERQLSVWRSNLFSTQELASHGVLVREIYFHVPAALKHPDSPPTQAEIAAERTPQGKDYWFFPFPKSSERRTVTLKAVYAMPVEAIQRFTDAWTGRAESPLLTYEISWGAPRR